MAEIKNILVTGATGLIGSALVKRLMADGEYNVFATGRNTKRAKMLFACYEDNSRFRFFRYDVREQLSGNTIFHYIVHAASNADPLHFANDPVGVIKSNIDGVTNLLDYGRNHGMERFLYVSSGEVYGSNARNKHAEHSEQIVWTEEDSGYVDSMNARSCYPSAKRTAETLCVSYAIQYGVDVVVARLCHTYGACFTESDNRVYAQFLRNVMRGEDIVLKSSGEQYRSWIYVDDCVDALMKILHNGESCKAYNVANEESNVTIRRFAEIVAEMSGRKVVFETQTPTVGGSTIKQAIFDTSNLRALGWKPRYSLRQGIAECLRVSCAH